MLKKYASHIFSFKFYFLIGALILAFFYAFSYLVSRDYFTRFDFDMTVRIQNAIPIRFDPHLSWFSVLGSFEVTLIILIVLMTVRLRKNFLAIFLVPAFGVMHVVEIIGKAFLDHPGTPFMFHRYALDFTFPSSYVQPGGSYPSGHSMRTVYLATLLLFLIWKSGKLKSFHKYFFASLIFFIVFIMLVSRVSLGEHWTTDVIGGSLLAIAFALFSFVLI